MFICSTLVTIVCNVHNDQIVDESHSQCGEFVQSWRWKTNEKIETFQFFYENATILNEWNMHLSDKRKKNTHQKKKNTWITLYPFGKSFLVWLTNWVILQAIEFDDFCKLCIFSSLDFNFIVIKYLRNILDFEQA